MDKAETHPLANKDELGRLRVAAATGVGEDGRARARALVAAEVDIIVVDTAHGHSRGVLDAVAAIKKESNAVQVIAGNVATPEGALALIEAGADAVKIGIGPGSICTTWSLPASVLHHRGAGMRRVACREHNVPAIADGGMRNSGDIVKDGRGRRGGDDRQPVRRHRTKPPARCSSTRDAPTSRIAGWAALAPWRAARPTATSSRTSRTSSSQVPEGIEGMVPYKGPVAQAVHQLVGGVRAGMGYTGSRDITALQENARFRRVTNAGLRESHVHDVSVTREAPNYRQD